MFRAQTSVVTCFSRMILKTSALAMRSLHTGELNEQDALCSKSVS